MQKDFHLWNDTKKRVNGLDASTIYFNKREIWWCHFGANIGNEQDGKGPKFMRPVLIYKKFSRSLCLAMPLSTKVASGSFFFPLLFEIKRHPYGHTAANEASGSEKADQEDR